MGDSSQDTAFPNASSPEHFTQRQQGKIEESWAMSNVDQAVFNLFGEGTSAQSVSQAFQIQSFAQSQPPATQAVAHDHVHEVSAYHQAMHGQVFAQQPPQPRTLDVEGFTGGLQNLPALYLPKQPAAQNALPPFGHTAFEQAGTHIPQPTASLHYAVSQSTFQRQPEAHGPLYFPNQHPSVPSAALSGKLANDLHSLHEPSMSAPPLSHTQMPAAPSAGPCTAPALAAMEAWTKAASSGEMLAAAGGMRALAAAGTMAAHAQHSAAGGAWASGGAQRKQAEPKKPKPDPDAKKEGKRPARRNKQPVFWTEEEHQKFLEGLEKFGQGNSLGPGGAEMISFFMGGVRSPLQIRSHAQKYFMRCKQSVGGKGPP